ncbi:thioredoxin [Goodfellowiella coeruleoviolacea]|uniref:Thioredoxin n=1 Tax=Goodfellowiella coeruleoviolacea TaxID=334858 RepID=A0AAE3GDJ7_9PSEU|nr:thioredoxin [Goodfellowiella coeruleoviolacea]MCP2165783.1 thioredoxin [Goodfellowiella coeruleoviolacea]
MSRDTKSRVIEVTDATFAEVVLNSDKPVLVDFWATWCPPCRMIAPVVAQIAEEYADRLTVVEIDVDANPVTARDCNIMAMPTLQVYQRGQLVQSVVGARPKAGLVSLFEPYL